MASAAGATISLGQSAHPFGGWTWTSIYHENAPTLTLPDDDAGAPTITEIRDGA